jgi:signal transduction histidine kinase
MLHYSNSILSKEFPGFSMATWLNQRISRIFTGQHRHWILVEAILAVAGIGLIDYVTGYEVAFFPFYSIPILLTVWFCGKRSAALICVLSGLAWFLTDKASGHHYSWEWLRLWDAGIRMMFYFLVLFAGGTVREQRDAHRVRIELLEHSRELEREIVNISEREQERIGRDLHDGLCQFLAAIGFAATTLKKSLLREEHPGAEAASEITGLLSDSIVYARNLARGLSPVDRTEGGLETALEELSSTTSRLFGVRCRYQFYGENALLDNMRSIHLFRIAQEAVSNALKHGNAKEIVITLDCTDNHIALCVVDDGIGFDTASFHHSGIGLNIMRYRARTLGGVLDVTSNAPRGTTVTCHVNCPNGEAPKAGAGDE